MAPILGPRSGVGWNGGLGRPLIVAISRSPLLNTWSICLCIDILDSIFVRCPANEITGCAGIVQLFLQIPGVSNIDIERA